MSLLLSALMTLADPNLNHASPLFRSLVDSTVKALLAREGVAPTWIVAAPGRVNLIGEHIDYNDGFVMPMAIDRYVVIAAAPGDNSAISSFYSVDMDQRFEVDLNQNINRSDMAWSNYVRGVLSGWAERGNGLPAVNAVVQSNVPMGGGLSSSAALEVATATLLEAATNCVLDLIEKALLAQKAEHDFAGVPCGIMDQFSSVLCTENALMLLDCRDQTVQRVPFAASDISVLITNSNVKHELTGGEYAQRRSQCDSALAKIDQRSWRDVTMLDVIACSDKLTETELRRSRHIVTEIDRTVAAATAIGEGEWHTMGQLMFGSHNSLRDDFDVSCKELDLLVEIACELGEEHGIIGSRMTGGGFGGCTVTLVRTDQAESTSKKLNELYYQRIGIESTSFVTRPARGAHRIEIENFN
jgi:galactokinase